MAKVKRDSKFFTDMEKAKGKQWLEYAAPSEIINNATKLFKDMAHGSIDKAKYGYAFASEQFMVTIYNVAMSNWEQNAIVVTALQNLWNTQPMMYSNPQSVIVYRKYLNKTDAYSTIVKNLNMMMYTPYPDRLTILDFITNQISRYRRDL